MSTAECRCGGLDDLAVIDMGDHEDVFRTLDTIAKRGPPFWWLSASCCRACGQTWLTAAEERMNDVYIVRKIDAPAKERLLRSNVWPTDFDRYATLLEIGNASGRRVWYADPNAGALLWTVSDLAREQPGISVSRLAALLNLDPTVAENVARKSVAKDGVAITFSPSDPSPGRGLYSRLAGLWRWIQGGSQ